ncbi:hypothetical protein D3C81_746860 [compost metagenome]
MQRGVAVVPFHGIEVVPYRDGRPPQRQRPLCADRQDQVEHVQQQAQTVERHFTEQFLVVPALRIGLGHQGANFRQITRLEQVAVDGGPAGVRPESPLAQQCIDFLGFGQGHSPGHVFAHGSTAAQEAQQITGRAEFAPGTSIGCVGCVDHQRSDRRHFGIEQQHALHGMLENDQLTNADAVFFDGWAPMAVGVVDDRPGPAETLLNRAGQQVTGILGLGQFGVHARGVDAPVHFLAPLGFGRVDQVCAQVLDVTAAGVEFSHHGLHALGCQLCDGVGFGLLHMGGEPVIDIEPGDVDQGQFVQAIGRGDHLDRRTDLRAAGGWNVTRSG